LGIKNNDNTINNKQISEAGYNNYWLKSHDEKLFDYVHYLHDNGHTFMVSGVLEHKGKISWMLDKLIKDFNYDVLDFNYNKIAKRENKHNTKEIIIYNY